MGRGSGREVILEFQRIGNAVKVTAVDPETLIEVAIMGSTKASDDALAQTAIDKLNYVLAKRGRAARPRGAR
jgi:hypothetical protein